MASDPPDLADLAGVAGALGRWLDEAGAPHVLIGGFAVAFVGRERVTRDVDAVAELDSDLLEDFLQLGVRHGFIPRHAGEAAFARRNRVLRLRHEPHGIEVDISLAGTAFEMEMIANSVTSRSAGARFPVARPQDMLVMKAVAGRPRDRADIEGILDRNPDVDLRPVRKWLRQFSAALDDPDLLRRFDTEVRLWRRHHENLFPPSP